MASLGIAKKIGFLTLGASASGLLGMMKSLDDSVKADLAIHAPSLKWSHTGYFNSLDHASIRRGFQVYKQVCSACHSMEFLAYRHMKNVAYTESELKEIASENMVVDWQYNGSGPKIPLPGEDGKDVIRAGKINDYFPDPYPNSKAAAYANNGAIPPDLSYMALARHGGEDYIFHLLTSYCEAPAGIEVPEGQHFNPYFLGGKLAMAPPLYNEVCKFNIIYFMRTRIVFEIPYHESRPFDDFFFAPTNHNSVCETYKCA